MTTTFEWCRWMNLLSTGNDWIEINFTQSKSTLIVGKNGHGKSQVLDALSLCLFNRPFRAVKSKNRMVNSVTGKGLLVEVCFWSEGVEYIVTRGIKPTIFKVMADGEYWNIQDAKDMQERLEKVLGFNYKTFLQIVILGKADYKPFMKLSAAERRVVVEDLLDLQVVSIMNQILKEKIFTTNDEIEKRKFDERLARQKVDLQESHVRKQQEDHEGAIKEKEKKIEELRAKLAADSSLLRKLEKFSTILPDARKAQANLANTIKDLEYERNDINRRHSECLKSLNFYKKHDQCPTCNQEIEFAFKEGAINDFEKSLDNIGKELGVVTDKWESTRRQEADVCAKLAILVEKNKKYEDLRNYMRWDEIEIGKLTEEVNDLKLKVKENPDFDALKASKEALGAVESILADVQTKGLVLNTAANLLKDDGVKGLIIKQYIPTINKLINKYLASLEFACDFHVDENFEERILSRYRDEFTYESFSEGQKARIDLAILFAWRALAKMRNSSSTNLLIFDEVLDSSLDQDGVDELMKVLNQLTPDEHVFIMSHRGDQLVDKFTDVIRFELVRSFSQMARETKGKQDAGEVALMGP